MLTLIASADRMFEIYATSGWISLSVDEVTIYGLSIHVSIMPRYVANVYGSGRPFAIPYGKQFFCSAANAKSATTGLICRTSICSYGWRAASFIAIVKLPFILLIQFSHEKDEWPAMVAEWKRTEASRCDTDEGPSLMSSLVQSIIVLVSKTSSNQLQDIVMSTNISNLLRG